MYIFWNIEELMFLINILVEENPWSIIFKWHLRPIRCIYLDNSIKNFLTLGNLIHILQWYTFTPPLKHIISTYIKKSLPERKRGLKCNHRYLKCHVILWPLQPSITFENKVQFIKKIEYFTNYKEHI